MDEIHIKMIVFQNHYGWSWIFFYLISFINEFKFFYDDWAKVLFIDDMPVNEISTSLDVDLYYLAIAKLPFFVQSLIL